MAGAVLELIFGKFIGMTRGGAIFTRFRRILQCF
jgi:hypothetical protein